MMIQCQGERGETRCQAAIHIIKSEHRSIAAILQGLLYLTTAFRQGGAEPDYQILRAMLYYLDVFPERLHHPKEDGHLFAKLRQMRVIPEWTRPGT